MGFNTYGRKTRSIGGGSPVWLRVDAKQIGGGTFEKLPPVGSVIPAGTPVEIKTAGGVAKILETFEVAVAVSGTDTTVKVMPSHGLTAGAIVMKTPNAVTDKGKAVKVGEVATEADGSQSFAITAGELGVLAKGDVLVSATAVGASAQISCTPTGLTFNDVYIEEGDTVATCASVYSGQIMEDRITPIPACVKALLPQINFQKGV